MKSLFGGFIVLAPPSAAETPLAPPHQQKQEPTRTGTSETRDRVVGAKAESKSAGETAGDSESGMMTGVVTEATDPAGGLTTVANSSVLPAFEPVTYMATAYCLGGRTASGQRVAKGLIAADPSVLPLGTRVRLDAGSYSGEYLVADTGGAVKGKRIDIWTPNSHEANRFGRRKVKLTVLSYPVKRKSSRRQRR